MNRISTHVLDTVLGLPASDIVVHLEKAEPSGGWTSLTTEATDGDGRCANLLPPTGRPAPPGQYRLRFETGSYHAAKSLQTLYPYIEIAFIVKEGQSHLHVPLLLSPNGYTTYRGS